MARSIFMVPVRIRWIEKLQCPFGHVLAGVVMSQSAREIGEVFIGIAKRIRPRILLQRILRHGGLEMFQRHGAFEAEFGRGPLKSGDGDGVIERIVQPAQMSGLRRDDQVGPDQPQVVTLARAEHHAMFARGRRAHGNGRRWSGAP